jgi:coenzyme F420-reducing hydrogenase beta subunit
MNNISEFSKCSNCGACYNACPTNAISVNENGMFYSLEVDEAKCVNCGLCKNVCPVNNSTEAQCLIGAYGGCHIDDSVVKSSSSGGAFTALAKVVLANGGIVYSAAFSEDKKEVVIKSTDEVAIEDLQRSKYVESKVGLSFREIKEQLQNGRQVLFCGAPCQVAGLKRYLNKEYENLLTCDFSCGGMPSHKMYTEYLAFIEKKLKSPITGVNFRPKSYGWNLYTMKINAENGKEYKKIYTEDLYLYCFVGNHISVRDYCYECDFANNHYADIVLADFWKCRTVSKIPDNNTGLSLIITNSSKGEEYISKISDAFTLTILDLDKASYNMVKKSYTEAFFETRKAFIKGCEKQGFIKASSTIKPKGTLKIKLKYYIKKFLGRA